MHNLRFITWFQEMDNELNWMKEGLSICKIKYWMYLVYCTSTVFISFYFLHRKTRTHKSCSSKVFLFNVFNSLDTVIQIARGKMQTKRGLTILNEKLRKNADVNDGGFEHSTIHFFFENWNWSSWELWFKMVSYCSNLPFLLHFHLFQCCVLFFISSIPTNPIFFLNKFNLLCVCKFDVIMYVSFFPVFVL